MVDQMKNHFSHIEVAFQKFRPENRKCIVNYNYIFCRLLHIYGLQEHMQWFPPLKSRQKIKVLDEIWDKMACYMGLPVGTPVQQNRALR